MTNIAYHTVISNSTALEMIRKAMVERYYLINCSASAVAREYGTKRQTVTKWINRFEKDGIIGLKDYPRTPHTEPIYKKSKDVENMIIALIKKKKHRIGQDRVRLESPRTVGCSTATINRIMHANDLIKKRKKKHQRKKQQCAEYKKTLRALRNWQIDVKELRDIPNITALVEAKIIPNFQYTARDQLTGTMFVCYAWEHSLINSIRFVSALFEHLKGFGIHSSEITIQTDNGSEFIGNIFAKKDSGFTSLIEQVYHAKHITIPIGKKSIKVLWKALTDALNMNSTILIHSIHYTCSYPKHIPISFTGT